jgi:tRNA(fMet)-specific endonuclease VapC
MDERYLLDTNTASYIIKGKPGAVKHLLKIPMSSICISTITEAELLLGVEKMPDAKHLPIAVGEFLLRVDILPWDSQAAQIYAVMRASCEQKGICLGAMDMLLAAHASSIGATFVTSDKAFKKISHFLKIADWS